MATAGSDRGIALYDLRTSTPIRKLIMQTKTNSIAWNPMEAFNFTAANEDCCLYTYDMRKLQSATCVHKDFVSAVMDVDYSPTGREFVAGSYDRSVRIFSHNGGHSKEVYHTKRMQRIFAVRFSGDGSYVFSGSDDMNVRVWKVGFLTLVPIALCSWSKSTVQKAFVTFTLTCSGFLSCCAHAMPSHHNCILPCMAAAILSCCSVSKHIWHMTCSRSWECAATDCCIILGLGHMPR